ncbi:MAG: hypothetical protein ASARMPREDX12_006397 [Alectoria sarmentosa]|nr:MAG: hypothetical protein ASARMPREDX12_006397 [Alectoria sarmentosa]
MSFGWSGGDVFLLAQLAWRTFQNSQKACGEYDELTREALRLHAVLQRLEQEVAKPESPINRPGETSKEQLERIATDCELVLKQLDNIVTAYASLSDEKRSARKIWQRVRFGNGQMADLGDLRSKLVMYTSEMLLYLNLVSMSTVGRIEQRMDRNGGVLRDIKIAVEKKTAHTVLCGGNREGSVLTAYADDDTGFWRGLRRDLIKDGLPSAAIHKHKHLIKEYVKELGARGILDEDLSEANDPQQLDVHANGEIKEEVQELPNDRSVSFNVPQTHDHNAGVQPLKDLNEKFHGASFDDTIAKDLENDPPRANPHASTPKSEMRGNTIYETGEPAGSRYNEAGVFSAFYGEIPSTSRKHTHDHYTTSSLKKPSGSGRMQEEKKKRRAYERNEDDRRSRERQEREAERAAKAVERDQRSRRKDERRRDAESKRLYKVAFVEDDSSDSEVDDRCHNISKRERMRDKERRRDMESKSKDKLACVVEEADSEGHNRFTITRDDSSDSEVDDRYHYIMKRERMRDKERRRDMESKSKDKFACVVEEADSEGNDRYHSKSKRGFLFDPSPPPVEKCSVGRRTSPIDRSRQDRESSSDDSSPEDEAASSRNPQGNSPSGKIHNIFRKFHTEFEPQCQEFLNNPPPDASERKKLYRKLGDSILQYTLLEIDAVDIKDEGLRGKKKQLIVDVQSTLVKLNRMMRAT